MLISNVYYLFSPPVFISCKCYTKERIHTYRHQLGKWYSCVDCCCHCLLLPPSFEGNANIPPVIECMIRSLNKSDEDIPVPPLVQSAALWGKYYPVIHIPIFWLI